MIVAWPGWPALLTTALPILGVAVLIVANISNIAGTWSGRWGTSPVTWGIWTVLGWVGLVAQVRMDGVIGAVLLVPVALTSTAVFAGTIKIRVDVHRGRRAAPPVDGVSWQRWIDRVCTVGGVAALAALVVSSGQDAMRLTILTDAIAAVPTITLGWRKPQSQPWEPFLGAAASAVCTLAVVPEWSLEQAGYAAYLLVMGFLLAAVIVVRRWVKSAPEPAPAVPELVRPLAADHITELVPPEMRHRKFLPIRVVEWLMGLAWQDGHRAGLADIAPPLHLRPGWVDFADLRAQAAALNGHKITTPR